MTRNAFAVSLPGRGVALLVYCLHFTVIGVYRGFITRRWSGALLFVRSTSFVLWLYGPLCLSSAYVIGSLLRHYPLLFLLTFLRTVILEVSIRGSFKAKGEMRSHFCPEPNIEADIADQLISEDCATDTPLSRCP